MQDGSSNAVCASSFILFGSALTCPARRARGVEKNCAHKYILGLRVPEYVCTAAIEVLKPKRLKLALSVGEGFADRKVFA